MARSVNSDPLLSHNFALLDVPIGGPWPVAFPAKTLLNSRSALLGFAEMDLPDVSLEMKDVKEGNWPFIHRVTTGFVSSGQVTLRQALLNTNTDMYQWFEQAIWGKYGPRRSFIAVNTRNDKTIPQRMHLLADCIPQSWKPSSNMSAGTSEVLMEELTMEVMRVQVIPLPIPVPPPNRSGFPTPKFF
jgi:phage tail-like protein